MGWRPNLQDKIPEPKSQKPDSTVTESTKSLAVLPGEDGALPFRTVLPLDEEPAHPAVLVVPVLDVDPEAPLQGVP